ncbi:hypothetical protein J1N35_035415 [Gossypium stocksii]|uniref:Uncharacterized protein n=1 Tax=Gossypium stocksii TaxID=47602 RepID=A0A9D3UUD9_9ROSI|nr:hypothetical protein J1N35_035415 [Gossypium stocksii]
MRVTRVQLHALKKEFETLHIKARGTVNDYFAGTFTIVNKMNANEDTSNLSIDELQSSLLIHEQMMTSLEEEQALKVTYGVFFNRR